MNPLRLYLLRHAESSRAAAGVRDIDRPLAPAGRVQIEQVAEIIERHAYIPARIACSTARRTRDTLAPLLSRFAAEMDICLTRHIYDADGAALLSALGRYGGDAGSLMIIGHNPSMAELAQLLVAGNSSDAGAALYGFPTAALAVIDIPVAGWSEVQPHLGRLAAMHTPGKPLT